MNISNLYKEYPSKRIIKRLDCKKSFFDVGHQIIFFFYNVTIANYSPKKIKTIIIRTRGSPFEIKFW